MRTELGCAVDLWPSCLDWKETHNRHPRSGCKLVNMTVDRMAGHCHSQFNHRLFHGKAAKYMRSTRGVNKTYLDLIELRDGMCREHIYTHVNGLNASCGVAGRGIRMSFRWKTFQMDRQDSMDRLNVQRAAERSRRVFVVIEGAGPHHFAKFKEWSLHVHRTRVAEKTLFTAVNETWNWPEYWIDDYVRETKQLMQMHLASYPRGQVCVVWKAMTIGPRLIGTDVHHPSVVNGVNHWLNRLARSAAEDLGIGVLDLSDLTMATAPARRLNGTHAAKTGEGDPYHGYSKDRLAPVLAERLCELCRRNPRSMLAPSDPSLVATPIAAVRQNRPNIAHWQIQSAA